MEENPTHKRDDANVSMILRQTNYTAEEAADKLAAFQGDPIAVIKDYMGIKEKPVPKKSLNQEIYTQIRHKLDLSMREFREKQEQIK